MDEEQNVISRRSPRSSRSPERASSSEPMSKARMKKLIISMAIYFCNFIYGCSFNFLSPCIIEFSRKFNTDVSEVSLVFSVITSSYLCGALLNGILFNFVQRNILSIFIFSLPPIALFLLPEVTRITEFFILGGFLGFFGGGADAIQIPWIIDIWRSEAPPYILAQHFTYSFGTMLPPLILAPFLSDENKGSNVSGSLAPALADLGMDSSNNNFDSTNGGILNSNGTQSDSKLYIPFCIAGALATIAVVVQVLLFVFTFNFKRLFRWRGRGHMRVSLIGSCNVDTERLLDSDNNEVDPNSQQSTTATELEDSEEVHLTPLQQLATEKWRRIMLIFLSCCCIASYSGLELCSMQFLPTFAVYSKVAFTEAQGAQLLFACTISYCTGRALGILLVLKIPPYVILTGNIVLLIISNLILLILAENSAWWLWFGTVLLGFAMSTTYPAYYAFIEKYIFVSNGFSTIVTVSAGLVSAIYPIIVGSSVKENPNVMIYVNFLSIIVLTVGFGVTFWVTWVKCWREGIRNGNGGGCDDNKRD